MVGREVCDPFPFIGGQPEQDSHRREGLVLRRARHKFMHMIAKGQMQASTGPERSVAEQFYDLAM
jgi:hypothetical protein